MLAATKNALYRASSLTRACVTGISVSNMSRRDFSSQCLTVDNMNPCIRELEYAVRGKVPLEALKIQNELKKVRCYLLFYYFNYAFLIQ